MGAEQPPSKSWRSRWFSAGVDQSRDTGLAMVLLCLLLAHFGQRPRLVPLALVLLVLTMVWPGAFRPLAGLWFGLSHLLGTVTSRIVLSVLYYGLVTPIGRWRRWRGADPLQLNRWKKDEASVFRVREGVLQPEDLEKPY